MTRYTTVTMPDLDPELVPVLPPAYGGQAPAAADREMVAKQEGAGEETQVVVG